MSTGRKAGDDGHVADLRLVAHFMHEMVKIDYLYGANWSIWLYLKILLRTVPYMLRRRGL
jgi:lipopolysaccharide/colanic/teichoic acid biosynthesis glycosyltransferase